MSKSICCYMIVQNEKDIIEYSITNPLLIFNKVIVIDGGSTDGTKKIIERTAHKLNMEHKLFLYDKPFTTLNDQRNFGLKMCKNCDFVMYLDADELMHPWELKKIRDEYINQYDLILIHSKHLYIDWMHEAVRKGDWFRSYLMPRVYKNVHGIRYTDYIPNVGDHDLRIGNIDYTTYFKGRGIICDYDDIAIVHTGHAMGRNAEYRKIRFHMLYDSPEFKNLGRDEIDKRVWGSCYFDDRIWVHHQNADPIGIIKFNRDSLPEILKSHPLYNVKVIND